MKIISRVLIRIPVLLSFLFMGGMESRGSLVMPFYPIHREIGELKVKSTFLNNSALTLVAVDTLGSDDRSINGKYPVEINGFEHSLVFLMGRAQFPGSLKNSTFISVKPLSSKSSKPEFYALVRWGVGIYPQRISGYWIMGISLGILIICFLFRRLILFFIVLVFLFFFFNKGLDLGSYLKGIYDWVVFHIHIH